MRIRKLLICKEPKNEIEAGLKRMYLKRVQELFKRTLSLETIFNIFDEVFHGLTSTSLISDNVFSFYESLLTVTSYYQHSQAGRGNLIAKLLEEFGTTEKIAFEFSLTKLPQWLGQDIKFDETELTKQKFDIVNKSENNLAFCELKMKVYSGCTAGRVELMEKFNKLIKLFIGNKSFRKCIKKAGINNVFLLGGVLFDIQGEPATKNKDEEWGICYNGLIRGKNDIIKTLKDNNIRFEYEDEKNPERAFIIKTELDNIKLNVIAVYGNEVIKSLFLGKQKYDIKHLKILLEEMLYDDLWLAQILTLSERAILDQNFKKYKNLNNYVLSIIGNDEILQLIKDFRTKEDLNTLNIVTNKTIDYLRKYDANLLNIRPIPAQAIFNLSAETYEVEDYVADLIQFLSCKEVVDTLK